MRVRIGTSGFSYKEWKGTFYPEDLPAAKMLPYYAERFGTVEINNTYYRMPKPSLLEGWAAQVPESFRFVLKAPQRLTHLKKGAELADPAAYFFETAAALKDRLGPVLLQLPPYLKKDVGILGEFLDFVPEGVRLALEIGSPTWLDDETYALLRARGVALCIVDDPKKRIPLVATAPFGYLRLRETTYGPDAIERWADQILAQPWEEAWVFFKHEDAGTGPRLGAELKAVLARRDGEGT